MNAPTLHDLQARADAVRNAPMFSKAAAAEEALASLVQYLAKQEERIQTLERKLYGQG